MFIFRWDSIEMTNNVIDEFNGIIMAYGIDNMYVKSVTDDDVDKFDLLPIFDEEDIILIYSREKEDVVYLWQSKEDFMTGCKKLSIFEICQYISTNSKRFDKNCVEFCKLVSSCETFDEIRLKMQLMGI
jgi:hypothetical protein